MSAPGPRIVFVAGLSGSGKSTAMAALEDLSYYGVDNLPPPLIQQFVGLCASASPPIEKIALAIDAREGHFLAGVPAAVQQLRAGGAVVDVIFLDSADDVLVNRYRETRRVHPLSPGGSVEEGIARERRLLGEVARIADFVLDTSRMNVHELRAAIGRQVAGGAHPTVVNLISFGFRFGPPNAAELLFDVRFLPNPHFEAALRPRTGLDPEVAEYATKNPTAEAFLARLRDLLAFLVPLYDQEGKAYLTIAIGCTGGKHRSVAIAELLARELRAAGREVNVSHRDMERDA